MNGESKGRASVGLCLGLWLGLGCGAVAADEGNRVALVIGNGGYTALQPLPNPKNDAAAVARALKGLGYRLVDRDGKSTEGPEVDLDQRNLIKAVNALAQAAQGQEIAFLYYAGHGFQDGVNSYLVPVDAPKLESVDELDLLKGRSVALDKVIRQVDGKARMSVAVFDACREIPELDMVTGARRGGLAGDGGEYRGLIPVRGGIRGEGGTTTSRLIAYAGAAGQLVKDGAGEHSPYTELLLDQLEAAVKSNRNIELTDFFQQVAWNFKDRQKGQQPLVEVAAKPGVFYLLPGPVAIVPVAPATDYDLELWKSAERCGTPACFQAYLEVNPQGRFVRLAKAQMAKVIPPAAPVAPVAPAAPVAPPPDADDAARQKRLDLRLAAAKGLLDAGKIAAARRALDDAKAWDRQDKVEAFRRERTLNLQAAALAFLDQGKRDLARRVVDDLGQWDPQAPEYRALRDRLAGRR